MSERVIDTTVRLVPGVGDELLVSYEQEITSEFLQDLQDRFVGSKDPSGELLCAAVIPTAIVDRWMRQGFNVFEEPIAASVARLRAENMGKFITTSKRI
jgi:hypothetical protein